MKVLKKMFYSIPSQVVSTFLLFMIIYVFFRGILATINQLPSNETMFIVLGFGILLGIMDALFEFPQKNKYD